MTDKKTNKITLLLQSSPVNVIGRFQVKASVMNNGVHKPSIMIVVTDLLGENFKIKFFKDSEEASDFITLLKNAVN